MASSAYAYLLSFYIDSFYTDLEQKGNIYNKQNKRVEKSSPNVL